MQHCEWRVSSETSGTGPPDLPILRKYHQHHCTSKVGYVPQFCVPIAGMDLPQQASNADRAGLDHDWIIAQTQAWLSRAVIGLNLCPFAKAVMAHDQIRYVVCDATDEAALLHALGGELEHLARVEEQVTSTTLLVHPQVLADFDDFNQFLGEAEYMLARAGFEGIFQLASFHPNYQFAGTTADDVSNASNRSPYPTLHLLRETSVERAVAAFADAAAIYETNIETLRSLGSAGWRKLMQQCQDDAHTLLQQRRESRG
jgi:hypothetical protein